MSSRSIKNFSAIMLICISTPAISELNSARIAVVQLNSDHVGDFDKISKYVQSAKSSGADIVIFPEVSDMGWLNPKGFFDSSPIPGTITNKFGEIAKNSKIWIVTGLAERGKKISESPATYEVYDSAVLINPEGDVVLHRRQFNVVKNAFSSCPIVFGSQGCSYTPGSLGETKIAKTPFGTIGLLVCADAYTYDTSSLDALKAFRPDLVLIPWGVTASTLNECGRDDFNATSYAAKAAARLQTAYVVGANGRGERQHGRFLPSWYCGTSGFAKPNGDIGKTLSTDEEIGLFNIPISR